MHKELRVTWTFSGRVSHSPGYLELPTANNFLSPIMHAKERPIVKCTADYVQRPFEQ